MSWTVSRKDSRPAHVGWHLSMFVHASLYQIKAVIDLRSLVNWRAPITSYIYIDDITRCAVNVSLVLKSHQISSEICPLFWIALKNYG